jgi:hypothetical protein
VLTRVSHRLSHITIHLLTTDRLTNVIVSSIDSIDFAALDVNRTSVHKRAFN